MSKFKYTVVLKIKGKPNYLAINTETMKEAVRAMYEIVEYRDVRFPDIEYYLEVVKYIGE